MSNSKIILRNSQINLLEKLMVSLERTGLQPAMAKIVSLLLISDEPELTFDEIRLTLEISKSATSTAINQLLGMNKIEYKSKLGDRKRYFCSRMHSWQEDVKLQLEGMSALGNLFQDVLDQRPVYTKEFNKNLKSLILFMDFLSIELPILIKRYENTSK